MAFAPNPGRCPPECDGTDEGKTFRVRVQLRSGHVFEAPARGRGEPNWRLTSSAWDIARWELVA